MSILTLMKMVHQTMGFRDIACNANDKVILRDKEHCEGEGKDRISELPEDIMLMLVSQLEMKELARVSTVSKGWRYLWTDTADLDFDPLIILPKCRRWSSPTPAEETKYFDWVNHVTWLHSGHSINKLRVQFGYSASVAHHIDRWVKFALSKRVKHLELNLPSYLGKGLYSLGFDIIKPSIDLKSLTHLHLCHVQVTGEFLEFLFLECPCLEQLFVMESCAIKRLKVASFKLKQLTINDCPDIEEIEIDALNLSYLKHSGSANVIFKSVPALVEMNLSGNCCVPSVPICQKIAPFAMQLSRLSFNMDVDIDNVDEDILPRIYVNIPAEGLPCFSNLECLELKCSYDNTMIDFPSIARLLGACPLLREFKMEVILYQFHQVEEEAMVLQGLEPLPFMSGSGRYLYQEYAEEEEMIEYRGNKAFPSMKVFEYVGFIGHEDDVNLVLYILDMATQLESFTCRLLEAQYISEDLTPVCKSRAHKLGQFVAPN